MKFCYFSNHFLRVRYGETDQMGYCYYGNYALYFEVGRVEALRELGMTYKYLEESGVMLPVSHLEIDYKRPAKYDDLLKIETHVCEMEGARLFFEYKVYNEQNELCTTGKTTLVFVDSKTMRPSAPPALFLEKLKVYEEK